MFLLMVQNNISRYIFLHRNDQVIGQIYIFEHLYSSLQTALNRNVLNELIFVVKNLNGL